MNYSREAITLLTVSNSFQIHSSIKFRTCATLKWWTNVKRCITWKARNVSWQMDCKAHYSVHVFISTTWWLSARLWYLQGPVFVTKDFLTWLLIGCQLWCQPIRNQVWKFLTTMNPNMLTMEISQHIVLSHRTVPRFQKVYNLLWW